MKRKINEGVRVVRESHRGNELYKAKLIKESFYDDHELDYDEEEIGEGIDGENYWEQVALAMGGTLISLNIQNESRNIIINIPAYGKVNIKHDWRKDGTASKPWTYVNGNDMYGRLTIWEDDPEYYAEDIMHYLK